MGFSRQEHWSGLSFSFSNASKWKVKVKSFSHIRLLATPWTAAYQALPSMGFSRQEYWSGCHCLLRMKVKSESEVAHLCLTLSDPMDCSLPDSSIHGIFQARVLEWGAIAFSDPLISVSLFPPLFQVPDNHHSTLSSFYLIFFLKIWHIRIPCSIWLHLTYFIHLT